MVTKKNTQRHIFLEWIIILIDNLYKIKNFIHPKEMNNRIKGTNFDINKKLARKAFHSFTIS